MTATATAPPARGRLTGDIIAGVSVALVLIPQALAYAEIAGIPAYIGLSAAALPPLLAAYFASSPYLQTGPVALTSLLTFGALAPIAEVRTEEYIKLAALLALLVGVIRLVLGMFRMGWVAYFMSRPVVLGFTSGAAVLILCSQLPKVFGFESDKGVLAGAFEAITSPGRWELASIVLAIVTVAMMFGGKKLHGLFPGVLIALIGALIWSNLANYSGNVVGELPGSYPRPSLDLPWSSLSSLILPGVIIAIVGFAEPASIARTYASQEHISWNADRELVGQGVANLASGIVGAFPVGGSFSRSAIGHLAGTQTRLAGAVTGGVVLLLLPVAPVLEKLPRAVLGAIVVASVIKLIRISSIWEMRKASRVQSLVAAFTFVVTLASAPRIEFGIIAGILASLAAHLYRESQTELAVTEFDDHLVLKPVGVMWFAAAHLLERQLNAALDQTQAPGKVIIDLGGVGRLGYSGAEMLDAFVLDTELQGFEVEVRNVPGHARRIVASAGAGLDRAWVNRDKFS